MCTYIHILTTYRSSKAAPEGSFSTPTMWGLAFLPELPGLPCKSSLFLSVLKIWLYFQTLFLVEIFGFSFMVSTQRIRFHLHILTHTHTHIYHHIFKIFYQYISISHNNAFHYGIFMHIHDVFTSSYVPPLLSQLILVPTKSLLSNVHCS